MPCSFPGNGSKGVQPLHISTRPDSRTPDGGSGRSVAATRIPLLELAALLPYSAEKSIAGLAVALDGRSSRTEDVRAERDLEKALRIFPKRMLATWPKGSRFGLSGGMRGLLMVENMSWRCTPMPDDRHFERELRFSARPTVAKRHDLASERRGLLQLLVFDRALSVSPPAGSDVSTAPANVPERRATRP
jgi:hypothetical protein